MSDDTLVATPPPAPSGPPRKTFGDRVRAVSFGIGEVLITLGLIVLLFVVYEVWITGIFARDENDKIAQKLEQTWTDENPTLQLPGSAGSKISLGSGVANIYIPRFGADYHWTIVEGTDGPELENGPGHYTRTAGPGEKGNFGVAGHRVGKGEPFLNLDKLRTNDAVIVETKRSWFVYRVLGRPAGADPQGNDVKVEAKTSGGDDTTVEVPGREIVRPEAGRVLLPVPNHADLEPVERLMTMTTCHPKFTAEERMIVHARLSSGETAAVPYDGSKRVATMPARIKALYGQVQG